MSLQGLISGSECAVPFNPLSQVLKHTEGDRSIQQDRIAGPSSSRLHHLPTTSAPPTAEHDLAQARQFFDAGPRPGLPDAAFESNRHFSPLPQMGLMQPDLKQAWQEFGGYSYATEAYRTANASTPNSAWATEFGSGTLSGTFNSSQQNMPQRNEALQRPYMGASMYGGSMSLGMYNGGTPMPPGVVQTSDKGKGKSRELDLDAAFAQLEVSLTSSQPESSRIVEVAEDGTELPAQATDNQRAQDDSVKYSRDMRNLYRSLDDDAPSEGYAKWEADFNEWMSKGREEDYGEMLRNAYEDPLFSNYAEMDNSQSNEIKFDEHGLPILDPYVFEPNNQYTDPSNLSRSALEEAKALLEQNGSLSDVSLLLEAAIQKGELGTGGYEAWILLGETRSMDEREDAAMRALTEGIRIAEQAGAPGEGMLSLAISFTNESLDKASHTMLLRWLKARYPTYEIPQEAWDSLSQSSWHSHEQVQKVFLNIARDQYSQGEIDPDVQTGLGVLFYTNTDYARAKDCFEAALTVRPKDFLLWNRLGSSLSNGNEPERALGAYREALQLRPTYTRAIYNVGVACVNIGAYKEAAEHFLSALTMQESSGGAKSDHLWVTLRRTFVSMDRVDLADKAKPTTSLDVFRQDGFDF